MKRLLLLFVFFLPLIGLSQCPPGSDIDSDGDGVLDCIDPCVDNATSIAGNLSFESDFIGWSIPQNATNFNISTEVNTALHGSKSMVVTAPNASVFENHAIESEPFILEPNVGYNLRIPVKRLSANDGDAVRWVLIDANGTYRSFNNIYNTVEDWNIITLNNLQIDFTNFTNNVFRLRLEFGLSTVDMAVDKIELYKTQQGFDPTYQDADGDGIADCGNVVQTVPVNDLVANAIEIDPTNYIEDNLRIDLATNSGISPPGCGTAGFPDVYYKFTATSNTSINALIADMAGGAITQSWVIFYNAPDLNQTDESQFSLASGCVSGTSTNISLSSGQSYYVQVHRNDPNALTSISFATLPDVPQSEREALIAFYNATGGDNWINNTNWNTSAPVRTWFGVNTTTTDLNGQPYADGQEHIWGINFFENNNLTGVLPTELGSLSKLRTIIIRDGLVTGNIPEVVYSLPDMLQIQLFNLPMSGSISANIQNLSNLQVLDIRGSNFSGALPDLTGLNLQWLIIQNNAFQFGDFENELQTYQNTIANFSYSPQKPLNPKPNIIATIGDIISIPAEVSGAQNNYEWYKRTSLFGSDLVSTDETLDFVFDDATEGTYFLRVTSNLVPNLVLTTPDFTIGQDPTTSPDYATLIDFYNSTDGPNWNNNTNWLNPNVPLSEWYGITTENNRVTEFRLQSNALTGQIPAFVTNLTELTTIFLNSNNLEGTIPDLSTMPNLATLEVSNNNFDFIDFETNFTNNTSIANFIYSPQNFRDNAEVIDAIIGNDYTFTMTPINGTNVQYEWQRVSTFDSSSIPLLNETTNTLNLQNIADTDLDAYSCFATSPIITDLIIKRSNVELKGPVSQQERNALIAFYNATGGANWVNAQNWNTAAPVSTWTGVTTTGNKVTRLALQSFNPNGQFPASIGDLTNLEALYIGLGDLNLTGSIPESIGNLTNLKVFWIQATGMSGEIPATFGNLTKLKEIRFLANNFTGNLPTSLGNLTDLTSVVMTGNEFFGNRSSFSGAIPFNAPNANISIQNNNFSFSDLEPFVQAGNYASFLYSPQRTQDVAENLESGVGANITLNVNDTNINRDSDETARNNNYQWYKDNVAITGANGANYAIVNAQVTDSGSYTCEITNPLLPDLTIVRAPITLVVDASLSVINSEGAITLSLYPNPVKTWLTIKSSPLTDTNLEMYDINGRKIMSQKLNGTINTLNVESLEHGTYILKFEAQNKVLTKRFIKQ